MTILLVTGSRSLSKIEGAREWVLTILRATGATTIHTGDARGPDTWARELVDDGMCVRVYEAQSGRRVVYSPTGRDYLVAWSWRHADFDTVSGRVRPLMRNRAMVDDMALHEGIKVLAFLDPASKTGGTKMTADYANKRGLWVTEHKWGCEVSEETKPEAPSSPARATIPESERVKRVLALASSVGINVGWVAQYSLWTVQSSLFALTCQTIRDLEETVLDEAESIHRRGIAAGEALAKWREGR